MSDQNAESGTVMYVIQRQDETHRWTDVEEVEAQPRSRRRSILQRYVDAAPVAGKYRVLDAESANEFPVELEEQPPRLKIG